MNILVAWLSYTASMEKAALGARAGGDTHIIELSKKASSLGHKVVMLTSDSGKLSLDVKYIQLKYHSISVPFENYLVKNNLGVSILYTLRSFASIFARPKGQFDVIVASSHYPVDVLSAFLFHLRNPGSKIVVYVHGISIPKNEILTSLISTIYNILGLLASSRFAHLIFVINVPTRERLIHLGVESRRIVITSNGIETEEIADLRMEKTFDACFLGRLVQSKGVSDLLSIWKAVCSKRPNARLAILGDGSERERLKKLIFETGLTANVTLLGFVFGDKKYKLLKSSKVFVFPSYLESWGIAVAEAMACGLPVVAYNLPIYKEVFEDKLVTVPLGDIDTIAKQTILLLENTDVARKIGEEGRDFVKRYDWKTVAEKELSVMINLINKR